MFTSIHDRFSVPCISTKQRIGHLCVRPFVKQTPRVQPSPQPDFPCRWHGATAVAYGSRQERASSRSHRSRAVASTNVLCSRSRERMGARNERGFITIASPVMISSRQCRAVLHRSQASTLGSTSYCTDPQLTLPAASQYSWGSQPVMRDSASPPSDAWP